ncbi:MAG: SIMPL domain-containing protein [Bacteroidales bacterium]|nr:SIMPL domain-containing protein [Bacteroidales bacterium]
MKKAIIYSVSIFSIAMVICVFLGGKYLVKARGHERTISVVGKAERDFVSDLIVWDFSYNVLDSEMKQGYASIKEINKTVSDYLASKGVDTKDIQFRTLDCNKENEYHYNNGNSYYTFLGYRLNQYVRIESNDVDKVEKISREMAELLDRGINLESNSLSYYYTKLSDLKIEMLSEASSDAHNRAETIAKSAGSHLSGLKEGNMGVFQITAPNSADEDYTWGGAFNTTSKIKRASINMRLTYYVR